MEQQIRVVQKLIEKNLQVATAESCTGGMLSAAITDAPGSSQ
ncbi:MAG: CinA family protein, partial [Clostridiales bacterium]